MSRLDAAEIMEKYEVLGQVGEGSFGQVYKAKKRSDGEIVAFKVIRKVRMVYTRACVLCKKDLLSLSFCQL